MAISDNSIEVMSLLIDTGFDLAARLATEMGKEKTDPIKASLQQSETIVTLLTVLILQNEREWKAKNA